MSIRSLSLGHEAAATLQLELQLQIIKLAACRTAVELGLANQPPDAPLLARWASRAGATSQILADQVVDA